MPDVDVQWLYDQIKKWFDDWSEKEIVELERLHSAVEEFRRDFQEIKTDIAMLKVKSGLWGATAGVVTVLLYVLYNFFKV